MWNSAYMATFKACETDSTPHLSLSLSLSLSLQCPYSTTVLNNILSIVLQIFLYLAVFECNTISNWLNHIV